MLNSDTIAIIIAIVTSVLGSSGLWAYLTARQEKKSAKTKLILGLAYDRIVSLCSKYIERGSITQSEYEHLYKYLYKPYRDLNGDGSAERAFDEVKKLPLVTKLKEDQNE